MTMPQWQYRTIYLNETPLGSDAIAVLNDAGGEGWELVGITANNVAFMKRQSVAPVQARRRKASADTSADTEQT
jgi:hypothetical protein